MAHNLTRMLRPGVWRIVLVVGSGHVMPLRNLLDEAPQFCPVSPLEILR
jgi:pheromone shutdown protein TraB